MEMYLPSPGDQLRFRRECRAFPWRTYSPGESAQVLSAFYIPGSNPPVALVELDQPGNSGLLPLAEAGLFTRPVPFFAAFAGYGDPVIVNAVGLERVNPLGQTIPAGKNTSRHPNQTVGYAYMRGRGRYHCMLAVCLPGERPLAYPSDRRDWVPESCLDEAPLLSLPPYKGDPAWIRIHW